MFCHDRCREGSDVTAVQQTVPTATARLFRGWADYRDDDDHHHRPFLLALANFC